MESEKTSTEGQVMGIIGIVLAIISLIVAFIPCVGVVALLPGILAIAFSIVSIFQASKSGGSKGLGIVALVISIIAILIASAWLILFSGASIIAKEAIDNPEKIELLEKGIRDAFKDEIVDDGGSSAKSDSLIKRLKELENEHEEIEKKIEKENGSNQ